MKFIFPAIAIKSSDEPQTSVEIIYSYADFSLQEFQMVLEKCSHNPTIWEKKRPNIQELLSFQLTVIYKSKQFQTQDSDQPKETR